MKKTITTMKTNIENLKPAIIQDADTGRVLMMAWVNDESLRITRESGRMTFYSRSRQKLWTKGEESGNFLYVKEILDDCYNDTLLVKVKPAGPACHTGSDTCWGEYNTPFVAEAGLGDGDDKAASSEVTSPRSDNGFIREKEEIISSQPDDRFIRELEEIISSQPDDGFIRELEEIISSRKNGDASSSYTAKLFEGGPRKIAKKLGEESAELIIEAMDDRDDLFLEEAADLLYHYLVLLQVRNFKLADVENILRERHK
jgi:phosphoribosyl-ATP pyrophosphohydrolase/phosphoribosyl-AMP cyclohydrolase